MQNNYLHFKHNTQDPSILTFNKHWHLFLSDVSFFEEENITDIFEIYIPFPYIPK